MTFKNSWSAGWTYPSADSDSVVSMVSATYEEWTQDGKECTGSFANSSSTAYSYLADMVISSDICGWDVWFNYEDGADSSGKTIDAA